MSYNMTIMSSIDISLRPLVAVLTGHPLHATGHLLADLGYDVVQRNPLRGFTPDGRAFRAFPAANPSDRTKVMGFRFIDVVEIGRVNSECAFEARMHLSQHVQPTVPA